MSERGSGLFSRLLLAGGLIGAAPANAQTLGDVLGDAARMPPPTTLLLSPRHDDLAPPRAPYNLQGITAALGGKDPKPLCIDPVQALVTGDLIKTFEKVSAGNAPDLSLTPEQMLVARTFTDFLRTSPMAGSYAQAAALDNTLLCTETDDVEILGAYYDDLNLITLSQKSSFYLDELPCFKIQDDFSQRTPANEWELWNTMAEEVVHKWQFYNGADKFYELEPKPHRGVEILYNLMLEAHAKMIVGIIAADKIRADREAGIHNENPEWGRDNVTQNVLFTYWLHGHDKVKQDASLLRNVFYSILNDQNFLKAYFLKFAANYNDNRETYEPPFTEMAAFFNHVPGFGGSLFDKHVQSYDDILSFMPPGTARTLLASQFPDYPRSTRPDLPRLRGFPIADHCKALEKAAMAPHP